LICKLITVNLVEGLTDNVRGQAEGDTVSDTSCDFFDLTIRKFYFPELTPQYPLLPVCVNCNANEILCL
jgi:hypothetical protein